MLMIAPGHDELDHRVLRSFNQMQKLYTNIELFLEEKRVSDSFLESKSIKIYSSVSFFDLVLLKKKLLNLDIFRKMVGVDQIYIHDSGLYGIFLIRYLNTYFPDKKIIFDYHDFLDWEILHHIGKFVKERALKKMLLRLAMFLLDKIVMPNLRINALIGISMGQVDHLLERLACNEEVFKNIVPNTRPFLDISSNKASFRERCNFLWVGNIGANRSFEKIDFFRSLINQQKAYQVGLVVVGKFWGDGAVKPNGVNYLGAFKSDQDIVNKLPCAKNIGLFFGWEDDFNLGINEVGSPNKVYSYINLGIPFLIPANLKDFIDVCSISSDFIYESEEDFIFKSKTIFDNYDIFCNKVLDIKSRIIWDERLETDLFNFYQDLRFSRAL